MKTNGCFPVPKYVTGSQMQCFEEKTSSTLMKISLCKSNKKWSLPELPKQDKQQKRFGVVSNENNEFRNEKVEVSE